MADALAARDDAGMELDGLKIELSMSETDERAIRPRDVVQALFMTQMELHLVRGLLAGIPAEEAAKQARDEAEAFIDSAFPSIAGKWKLTRQAQP